MKLVTPLVLHYIKNKKSSINQNNLTTPIHKDHTMLNVVLLR